MYSGAILATDDTNEIVAGYYQRIGREACYEWENLTGLIDALGFKEF